MDICELLDRFHLDDYTSLDEKVETVTGVDFMATINTGRTICR
ncbi:MAG: hypothetical protein JWM91_5296 [Rhodospirillales bacterium]|nr:hypothetical protein [Rhodospirillales bacterium]